MTDYPLSPNKIFKREPLQDVPHLQMTTTVHCPICNFEYNHLQNLEVISGNDNYEAWQGRGDCWQLNFECENGHIWSICFGEHKGIISAWSRDPRTESVQQ